MHTLMSILKLDSSKFYEVIPGLLYAGACPWVHSVRYGLLSDVLRLQIRDFITLREDLNIDEVKSSSLESYPDISILQYPIQDFSVPEAGLLREILDSILDNTASQRPVYISCAKGLGRTGLVIACFLSEFYGITGDQALKQMNELRMQNAFEIDYESPETQEQINYVLNWKSFTTSEV
jgi:protein-tyrosine phosphatase